MPRRRPSRRHHRLRYLARHAFTKVINDPERHRPARRRRSHRRLSRRQPRHSGKQQSRRRLSSKSSANRASKSSIRWKNCRTKPTSSSSKASTAGRTSNNSAPSPKASRSSSISRPPPRWPTFSRSSASPKKRTRPSSPRRRSASARKSRTAATDKSIGDMLGSETVEPVVDRKPSPRSVLLRHPWRRTAVHDHGHRLRKRQPHRFAAVDRRRRQMERWPPRHLPRPQERPLLRLHDVRHQRRAATARPPAATSRSSTKSASSSKPASRRSAAKKRSKSTPSWKPPTRASSQGGKPVALSDIIHRAEEKSAREVEREAIARRWSKMMAELNRTNIPRRCDRRHRRTWPPPAYRPRCSAARTTP